MSDVAGRHTLKHPLTIAGTEESVTEITLRRVIVRDLRAMDAGKTDVHRAIIMMARLSDLSEETISAMDAEDFAALSDIIGLDMAPTADK